MYNGSSCTAVGRFYGVHRTTIWRWTKRASKLPREYHLTLETKNSAPHNPRNQTPQEIVDRVKAIRDTHKRCAPVVHTELKNEGIRISRSTVERILRREGLVRKKKRRASFYGENKHRPPSDKPGALVQVDTIHIHRSDRSRYYIYTVLDTYSRLAYAYYSPRLSQGASVTAIQKAQEYFGFRFEMVQTDNGPEFKDYVMQKLGSLNIQLRHSRVRKPNDNAHLERFNRTIQEECFGSLPPNEHSITEDLEDYLAYYNNERLHLGLNCVTPSHFVAKVLT